MSGLWGLQGQVVQWLGSVSGAGLLLMQKRSGVFSFPSICWPVPGEGLWGHGDMGMRVGVPGDSGGGVQLPVALALLPWACPSSGLSSQVGLLRGQVQPLLCHA